VTRRTLLSEDHIKNIESTEFTML